MDALKRMSKQKTKNIQLQSIPNLSRSPHLSERPFFCLVLSNHCHGILFSCNIWKRMSGSIIYTIIMFRDVRSIHVLTIPSLSLNLAVFFVTHSSIDDFHMQAAELKVTQKSMNKKSRKVTSGFLYYNGHMQSLGS